MLRRKCCLILLLLCCASCIKLETQYGESFLNSINGFHVAEQVFRSRFDARRHYYRSLQLEDYDLIVHCTTDTRYVLGDPADSPEQDDVAFESFDDWEDWEEQQEETVDQRSDSRWIKDWLHQEDGRQFVLVLRDGNVAPQLCREWAAEFRHLAAEADSAGKKENFEEQAILLERRAETCAYDAFAEPGSSTDCYWFKVHGQEQQQAETLGGIYDGAAPHTLFTRSHLAALHAEVLLRVNDRAFIISIPVADSRLIVVANATAMVDAALVDPHARQLFSALLDELGTWPVSRAVWLKTMTAGSNSPPPPPNILAMLFLQAPFNYLIIHALLLLLAFLFWRACWLGRRRSQRRAVEEQFQRHIDALAFHLRGDQQHSLHCRAIARALGKDPRDIAADSDEAAIDVLQSVYTREQTHRYTRPADSKDPSSTNT